MTMTRLIRSELRKLTTTKMPWAFLAVLVVIAGLNAFAVIAGTDMDGSKAFIATEADQQSLMAFAANAFWRSPGCSAPSPSPASTDTTPSCRPSSPHLDDTERCSPNSPPSRSAAACSASSAPDSPSPRSPSRCRPPTTASSSRPAT